MSASLVGSEMCIRDSSFPRQPQAAQRGARTRETHKCSWQLQAAQRAAPVSYTHLTLPTICSV
eukprot:1075293-Alexandrium_andersonii.AAC.1